MSFAEGYVDVATRIAEFREQYPTGSLRPLDDAQPFQVVTTADGQQWIVVVAAARRDAEDAEPAGVGMAWEQYPGRTPYTRGSELQNAETSAWGRAIVAALAADTKKGVASADEVRNRQAERASSEMSDDDYARTIGNLDSITDLDTLRRLFIDAQRRGDESVMAEAKARAEAVKA